MTVSPPEANINWEQELLSTSKLNTLITAVKAHASSLEYIWLLGTKGVNGSSSVLEKLSDYLNRNKDSLGLINLKEVKFLDPIEMSEDNQVTECVRRTVDKVLINLPDGLKQSDIIADCTGEPRVLVWVLSLPVLRKNGHSINRFKIWGKWKTRWLFCLPNDYRIFYKSWEYNKQCTTSSWWASTYPDVFEAIARHYRPAIHYHQSNCKPP